MLQSTWDLHMASVTADTKKKRPDCQIVSIDSSWPKKGRTSKIVDAIREQFWAKNKKSFGRMPSVNSKGAAFAIVKQYASTSTRKKKKVSRSKHVTNSRVSKRVKCLQKINVARIIQKFNLSLLNPSEVNRDKKRICSSVDGTDEKPA